ncbi:hypothetical protein G4B88_000408 [Cannabis sativa]|uniref:60S ribosomal protein L6 n=1 Tax=Cannabis sativa TaxID=3483 RepID=A0A7J6ERP4_CANSA|nr:hypothetical protein G4B88_000408 [Cannabis sativa]
MDLYHGAHYSQLKLPRLAQANLLKPRCGIPTSGGKLCKHKPKPTKLRASITPGTVLIILAGRFEGKRVVFLKQLSSGLLLVTGPFKLNGVPIKRVNQSYVIGTSTNLMRNTKKGEGEFFEAEKEEKNQFPQGKKDDQKTVDTPLLKCIEAVPDSKTYLGARFSLKADMKPHELLSMQSTLCLSKKTASKNMVKYAPSNISILNSFQCLLLL